MKKCKILSFILPFIFSLFLCATSISSPVSAISVATTNTAYISNTTYRLNSGNPQTTTTNDTGTQSTFTVSGASSEGITLHSVIVNLRNNIPANTIISLEYTMRIEQPTQILAYGDPAYFYGFSYQWKQTAISQQCINGAGQQIFEGTSNVTYNGTVEATTDITCKVLIYNERERSDVGTLYGAPILKQATWAGDSQHSGKVIFTVFNPSWIQLDYNGLTEDDREWLADNIGSADSTAVVNKLNDLRSDTQAQTREIEQGNEEAQDRWEADKQEEADREEAGQDDADTLGSTFHFEIRNPFMGLLGLFTNNCPVSIPTIAGMLGSSQTTYPCWFSSQTRGILTPVIGISASVLLFGFIVRGFLRKGNFSGGIEI